MTNGEPGCGPKPAKETAIRLWPLAILSRIPRAQLLGLNRELAGMRGRGWHQKHATVNYAWSYPPSKLVAFHRLVLDQMKERDYAPDERFYYASFRNGKRAPRRANEIGNDFDPHYPEHDEAYLKECLANLAGKGIVIEMEEKPT